MMYAKSSDDVSKDDVSKAKPSLITSSNHRTKSNHLNILNNLKRYILLIMSSKLKNSHTLQNTYANVDIR